MIAHKIISNFFYFRGHDYDELDDMDDWKKGDVLGLACNLEKGTMQISLNGGSFVTVFSSGVTAGPVVGADLFPIMAGERGLKIRLKLGMNPVLSFRHTPPDFQYSMGYLRTIAESLEEKVCY
jgi:hypothetical protein